MVLALSEAGQRAAALALAAAGALAVWLVLLAVLALITRPRLPDPLPSTSDMGGTEPPAVAGFLVNRWEVGHETVPATLLDLAARGAVSIDQIGDDRFVCRLKREVPAGLTDYEEQVLDHVRRLASPDGVVPCEALTTGPDEESKGWWKRFEKAVVADARERGLSRSRWQRPAVIALGITAAVPALLAAGALVAAPDDTPSSEEESPVLGMLGMAAMGWMGLMAIPFSLRAEKDTPEGRQAAARWMGLQSYLDENESFDSAPPAAVAIWDRYLSYGAAMGVAAGAVRALPLGSESDTEAWSPYGGHWHVVRIRYPVRIPPGWGQKPLLAGAKGLAATALALFLAIRIGPSLADAVGDFLETSAGEEWRTWALLGLGVFGALLVALALFVLRSAVMLVLAVADLWSTVTVEGLVVRQRNGYVAVDDGHNRRVRAWRVEPLRLTGVGRGAVVRVTATRYLGYVSRIDPIAAATAPEAAAPPQPAP